MPRDYESPPLLEELFSFSMKVGSRFLQELRLSICHIRGLSNTNRWLFFSRSWIDTNDANDLIFGQAIKTDPVVKFNMKFTAAG